MVDVLLDVFLDHQLFNFVVNARRLGFSSMQRRWLLGSSCCIENGFFVTAKQSPFIFLHLSVSFALEQAFELLIGDLVRLLINWEILFIVVGRLGFLLIEEGLVGDAVMQRLQLDRMELLLVPVLLGLLLNGHAELFEVLFLFTAKLVEFLPELLVDRA